MKSSILRTASLLGGLSALAGSFVLPACSASPPADVSASESAAVTTAYTGLLKSVGGLCLDVYGNQQTTGAAVNIATCNGTTAQTFTITVGAPGPIVNAASGLCLDDVWGGGASMQMVTCMGTPEQQWTVWSTFPTSMQIRDDAYAHCVDVLGDTQKNSQTVDPSVCNGTPAQVWSFQLAPPVCGGSGYRACATSPACNPGLNASGSPAICCPNGQVDSNKTCVPCGASGELVCGGNTCNSGLGVTGTICCPASNAESNGKCVPCGAVNETVCGGNICKSGLTSVNGTCKPCGAKSEPCCSSGSQCGGGLSCEGGTCGVPCAGIGQTGTCCPGLEQDQNNGNKCATADPAGCGNTTIGDAPPCCKNKRQECSGDGICLTDPTTSPPYSYCCSPSAQTCQ